MKRIIMLSFLLSACVSMPEGLAPEMAWKWNQDFYRCTQEARGQGVYVNTEPRGNSRFSEGYRSGTAVRLRRMCMKAAGW